MKCMRGVEFEKIEEAAAKVTPEESGNPARTSPVFQPTPDEMTVLEDYKGLIEGGRFARLASLLSFPQLSPSNHLPPSSLHFLRVPFIILPSTF